MTESISFTSEQWFSLAITILMTLGISLIAFKKGFYRFPQETRSASQHVTGGQVTAVFVILMTIQTIFTPIVYYIWASIAQGSLAVMENLKPTVVEQGWINVFSILSTAIAIGTFCSFQETWVFQSVFGESQKRNASKNFYDFLFGAATWVIVYPIVGVVGQLIILALSFSFQGAHLDQIAVRHVKNIMENPWLFQITIFEIIFIVPVIEELLFRGFLQNWVKYYFGVCLSIILTSVVFAFFHISISQGINNIELIGSLFVLSLFLGFLRERQDSLLASVGLHSTFNAVSIWLIANQISEAV